MRSLILRRHALLSEAPGWPEGVGRVVLETTDSTNAESLRRARDLEAPVWVCALHQSAARGRQGRRWAFPAGNFAATLAMRLDEPPAHLAQRSFVAALAVYDTLAALIGSEEALALKWPNDVLLGGGKVAGILLETTGQPPVLAIGIGVNLKQAPRLENTGSGGFDPVALSQVTRHTVTPSEFLDRLAPAFDRRERTLVNFGFAPIRAAWLARAARLGETITARTSRGDITGVFRTVDDTGQLVLSTSDSTVVIPAADVYF